MRRALVWPATALLLSTTACSDAHDFVPGPNPGPVQVDVDTPDLRALKKEAGVEPCRAGSGGGELPALTLPCLGGGRAVDLSTLRGPMVISFWAAWCEQCAVEMPALQSFHERYGDQVPVLGIDWNDTYPGTALEQVRDRKVTYPLLADPGGDTQAATVFAQVGRGLPYLVLVDAAGRVAYDQSGGIDSEAELADLVHEHLGVDL